MQQIRAFNRRGVPIVVLCLISLACAAERPASSSAIVRQGVQPASAGGGNFEQGASQQDAQQSSSDQISDKTLVIGIASEVRGFSPLNGQQNKYVEDLVQGNLYLQDDQGHWYPAIAADTPSIENGTWKLFDDGTMETVYHIKKGVKWHDGVEFTVNDLVFFWQVGRDPDLPYASRDRTTDVKNMEPLDDYSLRVTWNILEAEADTIDLRMWWPMPRHILAESYATDKQRFLNHPFWSTEFVGLGPYRLTKLDLGSHMELAANSDYVLGQPRLRNVVVRFFQDSNALIASLLSGDVQLSLQGSSRDGSLSMAEGITLGTQWSASHEGKVLFNPYRIELLALQWNREFQRPAALSDVRVRQALLLAIDRQALVDQQFSGFTSVAEAWVPSDDPDFATMADGLPRYPYDPSRAQQLLADAGWKPGGDGTLANGAGSRFEVEYRAIGAEAETTSQVIADSWKRVGVDTQLNFVPRARVSDNEWMAKFPGVRNHNMVAAPVGGATSRYTCGRVATEANDWLFQASNPAGYCTQEAERWIAAMDSAFPFDARMKPFREVERIAMHDLPYLPLYFGAEAVAVRSNVGGITRVPPKNRGRIGMHSYMWTLQ